MPRFLQIVNSDGILSSTVFFLGVGAVERFVFATLTNTALKTQVLEISSLLIIYSYVSEKEIRNILVDNYFF